jgi:Berberine and berberine like
MKAPPMPPIPEQAHGKPMVMALLCWAGEIEAVERAIARFRGLATPLVDMVRPMPYPEIVEPVPEDHRPIATMRNMFLDALDREAAETILDGLEAATAPMAVTQLRVLGGAVARVPADATAFAHRDRRIMANVNAMYPQLEERPVHEAWVNGLATELSQGDAGAYVGFLGDEGVERVRAAYPGSTWDRLAAIKARYDPDNLFRLNQNIPPA